MKRSTSKSASASTRSTSKTTKTSKTKAAINSMTAAASSALASSSSLINNNKKDPSSSSTRGGDFAALKSSLASGQQHQQEQHAKPLRTFINGGAVTCLCVNQAKGDLLCAGTAHGDIAVVAPEVADQVLAEEAGGNAETIGSSSVLRNAHRKKVTAMTCDNKGNFVTGSGDGSLKIWTVDPSASLFPVCIKTLFPQDYAVELEKPFVPPRQKKFEVPEVTDVVVVDSGRDFSSSISASAASEENDSVSSQKHPTIIYAAYSDGLLRKWNAETEQCIQMLKPSYGRITSLSMLQGTPSYALCCGNDSGVVTTFFGNSVSSPTAFLTDDDALQITWPESIRSVTMVNCFVPPTSLKNPSPPPVTLCFAGSTSGTIYGFDLSTGEKKTALKHFGCSGTGEGSSAVIKLIQGPNCLLSAHDNGSVILWNILDWTPAGTFWHSAVEGRTTVLSNATLFSLGQIVAEEEDDDEENQQQQQQDQQQFRSSTLVSPTRSVHSNSNNRPASSSMMNDALAEIPSSRVALITSTMSGSISVWTNCVINAIEKLRGSEKAIADEVIERLKAKRAEEKAKKRRGLG